MSAEPDLSVVAPCFNESGNLAELVRRTREMFASKGIAGELILVNDGSADDTGEVIESLAAESSEVRGVHHEINRGITAGWASGLEASRGRYVCLIDADLQYRPEDAGRLLDEMRASQAGMIQGSRVVTAERDARYLYSRVLNTLLNTMFGMRLKDNKSGFVLCPPKVLRDVLLHREGYRFYQCFIAIAAHHHGHTIREIDVHFDKRAAGTSFMSSMPLRVILGVFADLPKAFVEFRMRKVKR